MITFFFLMVDGQCIKVEAESLHKAFDIVPNKLGYDSYFEFIDDLNLCEWKDGFARNVQDFANGGIIHKFDVNTSYQLEPFTKKIKTKRPTRQLEEEFGDID